jgi:hypothetical protein
MTSYRCKAMLDRNLFDASAGRQFDRLQKQAIKTAHSIYHSRTPGALYLHQETEMIGQGADYLRTFSSD